MFHFNFFSTKVTIAEQNGEVKTRYQFTFQIPKYAWDDQTLAAFKNYLTTRWLETPKGKKMFTKFAIHTQRPDKTWKEVKLAGWDKKLYNKFSPRIVVEITTYSIPSKTWTDECTRMQSEWRKKLKEISNPKP